MALKGFFQHSQTALARSGRQKKRRLQVSRAAASGRGLATSEKIGAKACVDVIGVAKCHAHSPFGGSVATRILRCPASVHLIEKVPAHSQVIRYADRGTALHAAMALLIENESFLAGIVGEKIDSYIITLDDVRTLCGRFSLMWKGSSTTLGPNISSNAAFLSRRPRRLWDVRPDRPQR